MQKSAPKCLLWKSNSPIDLPNTSIHSSLVRSWLPDQTRWLVVSTDYWWLQQPSQSWSSSGIATSLMFEWCTIVALKCFRVWYIFALLSLNFSATLICHNLKDTLTPSKTLFLSSRLKPSRGIVKTHHFHWFDYLRNHKSLKSFSENFEFDFDCFVTEQALSFDRYSPGLQLILPYLPFPFLSFHYYPFSPKEFKRHFIFWAP